MKKQKFIAKRRQDRSGENIMHLAALSKKYKDVPEYKLYYGSAIGLKARISLGKKQWFSTISSSNIEKHYVFH